MENKTIYSVHVHECTNLECTKYEWAQVYNLEAGILRYLEMSEWVMSLYNKGYELLETDPCTINNSLISLLFHTLT